MNKLYVVMPAYNEAETIEKVVQEWHAVVASIGHGSKLAIFNDGSTDGTLEVLNGLRNKYPNMLIINKTNTGHGPTCLTAYKFAVAEKADWVFQTDSDGQTTSQDFWYFWEQRNSYDFIFGQRTKRRDGLARMVISQVLRIVLFVIFRVSIKDANTPFRLMKTVRLRYYLSLIPDNFFIPNTLLSVMTANKKEKVLWKEISFTARISGKSSIPLVKFGKLGIRLVRELYKMRSLKISK